jgi:hypothetical protein
MRGAGFETAFSMTPVGMIRSHSCTAGAGAGAGAGVGAAAIAWEAAKASPRAVKKHLLNHFLMHSLLFLCLCLCFNPGSAVLQEPSSLSGRSISSFYLPT